MGTVRKRGDKFQGIVRVSGHDHEYETFDSQKAAKAWIRDREKVLESRSPTSPDILITDLIDKYVSEIAPNRKMAHTHLDHDVPTTKKAFKGLRIRDLFDRGLTDWVLAQTVTAATRNGHVIRLFGILRQVETHWDMRLPWDDMRRCRNRMRELGYLKPSEERERRVSDAEFNAIKKNITKQTKIPAADLFEFCIRSAMRIGEVCRIEWDDLDEASQTIVIRDRKHPKKKFGNHQTVPLLNGSFDVIKRQPRREDVDAIFPYDPRIVSKAFHRAVVAAKLDDVVLHDLRHEAISRMFELGFAIQEVALVSGHTNWRTLRRYTHLKPASLVQREAQLRAMLEKEKGATA